MRVVVYGASTCVGVLLGTCMPSSERDMCVVLTSTGMGWDGHEMSTSGSSTLRGKVGIVPLRQVPFTSPFRCAPPSKRL